MELRETAGTALSKYFYLSNSRQCKTQKSLSVAPITLPDEFPSWWPSSGMLSRSDNQTKPCAPLHVRYFSRRRGIGEDKLLPNSIHPAWREANIFECFNTNTSAPCRILKPISRPCDQLIRADWCVSSVSLLSRIGFYCLWLSLQLEIRYETY